MKSAENYPSPKWSAKCPDCGHKHYRELDMGTILKIRGLMGERIRIPKLIDEKEMEKVI